MKVHKTRPTQDFLQISKSTLFKAYQDLGATGLVLYLYFASNRNEYVLALSPAAINYTTGMPLSTFRDQFRKLMDRGYLAQEKGHPNHIHFYESPYLNPNIKDEIETIEEDPTRYIPISVPPQKEEFKY